jgi:4-hydroxyphenylpyruvate dioxygenase-like putative hemolysin
MEELVVLVESHTFGRGNIVHSVQYRVAWPTKYNKFCFVHFSVRRRQNRRHEVLLQALGLDACTSSHATAMLTLHANTTAE